MGYGAGERPTFPSLKSSVFSHHPVVGLGAINLHWADWLCAGPWALRNWSFLRSRSSSLCQQELRATWSIKLTQACPPLPLSDQICGMASRRKGQVHPQPRQAEPPGSGLGEALMPPQHPCRYQGTERNPSRDPNWNEKSVSAPGFVGEGEVENHSILGP